MKKLSLFMVATMMMFYCRAQVDSVGLDKVFGRKGTVTGNVYRVTFPRTVVAKLVELGLGVTAIHNHLVGEKPAIKFLHFSGRDGDAGADGDGDGDQFADGE